VTRAEKELNAILAPSVGKYLSTFENLELKKLNLLYFRGESEYHEMPCLAGAFRDKWYNTQSLCEDFYSRVFAGLTTNEERNFLAFSQHHGIKTNLIDITTNKLIALYFACSSNPGKNGYVYCFNGNFFNINNCIQVLRYDEMHNDLENLLINDDFRDNLMKDLIQFEKPYEIKNLIYSKYSYKLAVHELRNLFEKLPIAIYKPLLSFDRAVSQHSLFIYQLCLNSAIQIIKPTLIFKIQPRGKKIILDALDKLDINEATVYKDYDSIAKYVNNKHKY
jgi:hypothetical protein